MLNGLSQINIELTSRCDKACSFCGHQNPDINKKLEYGDMDFYLLREIRDQLPRGIVVQFHRDGEPLIYERLDEALFLFSRFITSIVTNGKKLVQKADQIILNCTSLTVSAFRGDPDGPEQLRILTEFLKLKDECPPLVMVKWVGDGVNPEYEKLGVPIIRRLIHVPDGNYKYAHKDPTIPEIGICLDFLHHPSIDWKGNLYVCNRLDGEDKGLIGNLREHSLDYLWNSPRRVEWLEAHKNGRRDLASALCKNCKFYGVPSQA